MERHGGAKLEEIFKDFKAHKEFYGKLDRIMKIIKINNKNDLLKSTYEREVQLIREIEDNLSPEKMKTLWRKTVNRKSKDRIKLFRELLDLTESPE